MFVSAGVETVSRFAKGNSDSWPDTHNPIFADAEDRSRHIAENGADDWSDPRGRRAPPRHLHRDGADRREPGPAQGRHPRGHGPLRRALAEPRREGDRQRVLRPRDHPGHAARRHGRQHRRRAARRGHLRGASASSSRCSGPTAGSRRATAARSTTAPPRWWSCPTRRRAELGITPLARVVSTGVSGLSPEIMGLGPGGGVEAGAGPRGHVDRRRRPRRDQRGVRGAGAALGPRPGDRRGASSTSTAARSRSATRSA